MHKMYIIRVTKDNNGNKEEIGYICDNTIPTQDGFDVYSVPKEGIHKCKGQIVAFFSPNLAQNICDKLTQVSQIVHPANIIIFEVVSETFSADEAVEITNKPYMFSCEVNG